MSQLPNPIRGGAPRPATTKAEPLKPINEAPRAALDAVSGHVQSTANSTGGFEDSLESALDLSSQAQDEHAPPNDTVAAAPRRYSARAPALASSETPYGELGAGNMVGEYRVEGKLGEGSFGVVYHAIHPVIGKNAAVKVLHHSFSVSPDFVQRFVEEARAANRIRHRGIIDIFGFGALPDGRQYYVMEKLEGCTLEEHSRRVGPLDLVDALPILRGIARAIDAAHSANIIHRDLKPENVFLVFDEDQIPKPKILDFGIAKLLGDINSPAITASGTPLGTPPYMSPEQCRGLVIDKATDIYAFGIMTFEMLTGSLPFDADNATEMMAQHLSCEPPAASERRPALSRDVDQPILHMLAKDPSMRPLSLTAAVEELAKVAGYAWQLNAPRNGSMPPLVNTRSAGGNALLNESPELFGSGATGVSQVTGILIEIETGEPVRASMPPPAPVIDLSELDSMRGSALSTTAVSVSRDSNPSHAATKPRGSRNMVALAIGGVALAAILAIVYLASQRAPSASSAAHSTSANGTTSTQPGAAAMATGSGVNVVAEPKSTATAAGAASNAVQPAERMSAGANQVANPAATPIGPKEVKAAPGANMHGAPLVAPKPPQIPNKPSEVGDNPY